MPTINISSIGMEGNEEVYQYIRDKIEERFKELLSRAGEVKVTFKHHPKRNYTTIIIMIYMPRVVIRVEERGENIKEIVDKALDKLGSRLRRYNEKIREWRGEKPWSILELEEEMEENIEAVYPEYVPRIRKNKLLCANEEMEVGEAIEYLELMDVPCYLFKNKENGKWSVVYRLGDEEYGLTETP